MQISKLSEQEILTGIILRGKSSVIEQIIQTLEKDKNIKLVYVRRARPESFLIIIETHKVGGTMNAFNP
jgi:cell division septal protein FtsQ